jgi:molybdopterin-containing oxidoreductase family iron-sulfur binding subunit
MDASKNNKKLERSRILAEKALNSKADRRTFLKLMGMGAAAAAVSPNPAAALTLDEFFQKHYKELSPEDKIKLFARIEKKTKEKYGKDVKIVDPQAMDGVKFVYCLNLTKCIGCRKCVYACVKENNPSRDPQIQYIKVLEMDNGSFDLEKGNLHYDPKTVPRPQKFYMPIQCHQCDNPPCVKVCPVEATWKEKDGIVVIDYDWCIGCRYCEAACPYGARSFNFTDPKVPADEVTTEQGFLSNRIRPRGVVEKCTFCLHRTRKGLLPACLEACPTGSRKFGNILDPKSEVRAILETKRIYVLKEELNTLPRFYYFFD